MKSILRLSFVLTVCFPLSARAADPHALWELWQLVSNPTVLTMITGGVAGVAALAANSQEERVTEMWEEIVARSEGKSTGEVIFKGPRAVDEELVLELSGHLHPGERWELTLLEEGKESVYEFVVVNDLNRSTAKLISFLYPTTRDVMIKQVRILSDLSNLTYHELRDEFQGLGTVKNNTRIAAIASGVASAGFAAVSCAQYLGFF